MEYHRIKQAEQRLEAICQAAEVLFLQATKALEDLRMALAEDEKQLDQSLDQSFEEHA